MLDPHEQLIRIVLVSCSSLSLLGTLLLLTSFYIFPRLRTYSLSLVMLLSVTDSIYALCYIVFYQPPESGSLLCDLEGWLFTFCITASVYFSAAIANHLYNTVMVFTYRLTGDRLVIICCVVYGIALINASVPINYYDNLDNACWISNDSAYLFIAY